MLFLAQDRQEALAAMIEDLPQAKRAANADGPEKPKPGLYSSYRVEWGKMGHLLNSA